MKNEITTEEKLTKAMELLNRVEEAPDENWFRDLYSLTGEHMVRTEEGWVPACMNTRAATGEDPMEVLEEVNAP